jgi:hypothetical protein
MDRDGWPDLIMATHKWDTCSYEPAVQLLFNNGDGTFLDETLRIEQDWAEWEQPYDLDCRFVVWPLIIDTNGGGWQDILAIGGGVEHVLFESYKGERYDVALNLSDKYSIRDYFLVNVAPRDFNRDGNIDFALLYINTSNQQVLLRK